MMEGWALWWEVVMEEKEGCEAWPRTGREELLRKGGGAPAMVLGGIQFESCGVGVNNGRRTTAHVNWSRKVQYAEKSRRKGLASVRPAFLWLIGRNSGADVIHPVVCRTTSNVPDMLHACASD